MPRLRGAREIGFTVISLTMSLIAVFIPLLFMTGLVGRMFREFALTLTIAVVVSAIVSLTLTPMMCSRILRHQAAKAGNRVGRFFNRVVDRTVEYYGRSLEWVLRRQTLTLLVTLGDAGRHGLALYRHAEGLPAVAGHRLDLRGVRGRHRGLVRSDAAAAGAGRGRDQEGPGRHRPGLGARRQPDESDAECRPPRHHAAAARRAPRQRRRHRRPSEAGGRADPRHDGVFPAGAGHPDQHAGKPRAVSVHAGRHRRRRRASSGPRS